MNALTEQPEYTRAIPALSSGDFQTARTQLEALVSRLRGAGETRAIPYLLHVLGDVEARAGNSARGHALHIEACELGGPHPFEHVMYATSLVRSFHEPSLALTQLDAAESLIRTGRWAESEDDMPREWYEREIASPPCPQTGRSTRTRCRLAPPGAVA